MFEIVDLNSPKPERVRVAICQLAVPHQEMQNAYSQLSNDNVEALRRKISSALDGIKPFDPKIILFPEASIDQRLIEWLHEWAIAQQTIIVAGTHYVKNGADTISVSPVLFPDGHRYDTEKFCISPFEKSVLPEASVAPGSNRYIFRNTPVGNFCVLICADYLDESTTAQVFSEDIDLILVSSCQPNSERYHKLMGNHCINSAEGVYVAYANLKTMKYGDGASALFGVVHRNFTQALIAHGLSDLKPEQKLWQAGTPNDFVVADLDLAHKRPPIGTSVHDNPNVEIRADRRRIGKRKKVQNKSGKYRLVAFDMDGTILRGLSFSWSVLWEFCGDNQGTEWKKNLQLFTEGRIRYDEWCNIAVAYFNKARLTKGLIADIAKEKTRVTENFDAGIIKLREIGLKTAIISGGVDIFLRSQIPDYSDLFDHVYINNLHFDADDVVSGVKATAYDFEGKLTAIQDMCEQYGFDVEETIYVGDRFNDQTALAGAGHSIVYSEADDLVSLTCDMNINEDNFLTLVDYIESICRS